MTFKEIANMIESIGLPYAYYQFEEGSGQQCPFLVFYYPYNNDFKADNKNYVKVVNLTIELYSDEKDFSNEAAVETVLDANDMTYTKEEMYIDSEKMYETVYNMEVIINGE